MTALALKEPDCVPFADWIDDHVKQDLLKAMDAPGLDDAEFAGRLGMDGFFHCTGRKRQAGGNDF